MPHSTGDVNIDFNNNDAYTALASANAFGLGAQAYATVSYGVTKLRRRHRTLLWIGTTTARSTFMRSPTPRASSQPRARLSITALPKLRALREATMRPRRGQQQRRWHHRHQRPRQCPWHGLGDRPCDRKRHPDLRRGDRTDRRRVTWVPTRAHWSTMPARSRSMPSPMPAARRSRRRRTGRRRRSSRPIRLWRMPASTVESTNPPMPPAAAMRPLRSPMTDRSRSTPLQTLRPLDLPMRPLRTYWPSRKSLSPTTAMRPPASPAPARSTSMRRRMRCSDGSITLMLTLG